ncbi:MAG: hypothetical protein QXX45_03355 [Candidatus Aenigmatarchaeota archaeon]
MAIIDNSLFQLNAPSASTPLGDTVYNHVAHHQAVYDELNSIEDSLVQGYVRESDSVSYSSSSSFTVLGNKTDIYTPGRIVRFSDGTTAIVSSSSYSSPNTIVNIVQGTVPSTLSYVDISLQPKGGTNQFLKATGSDINIGTEDAKIVTPKAIADSNVVFTDKTQTLTNKTLTSPVINTSFSGTAKASGSDINIGTEDAKIVTPKAIADSKIGYKTIGFKAVKTVTQTANNSTATKVQFDTEIFDNGNNYDNSTNYRFIAPYNGVYFFYASICFQSASSPFSAWFGFYKNGSYLYIPLQSIHYSYQNLQASTLINLNANDYIEVYVNQFSGGSKTIHNDTTTNIFSGFLVYRL